MAIITGTPGNDLRIGTDDSDTIDGAGGNDFLHGLDGDDTIQGGTGHDEIYGYQGADLLFGGAGNDYVVMGRPDFFGVPGGTFGSDTADGGDGIDMIVVSWWNQLINGLAVPISLDFGNGNFTVHGGGSDWEVATNFEQLAYYGSDGGDKIIGGDRGDFFQLGKGNDDLNAKGGNDYIFDTGGAFKIDGGAGIDTLELDHLTVLQSGAVFRLQANGNAIIGGSLSGTVKNVEALYIEWNSGTEYDDYFGGGAYGDTIHAGSGNDRIEGAGGNDSLLGARGDDTIYGGAGNDTLDGGDFMATSPFFTGSDTLYGEAGNDAISGGAEPGFFYGGPGNDSVSGQGLVRGDDGNDSIGGSGEGTRLLGGAGNDYIMPNGRLEDGGIGHHIVSGGGGDDTVSYNGHGIDFTIPFIADLLHPENNTREAAGATYISIENLEGSNEDDTLRGDNNANRLDGGYRGTLGLPLSGWGNDTLEGRGGADTLDGGTVGRDTASYQSAPAGVRASLAAPATNTGDAAGDVYVSMENLEGSAFADVLTGDGASNRIDGLAGNDIIIGGAGADTLRGGPGNDIYLAPVLTGAAADTIIEDAGGGTDMVKSAVTATIAGIANVEQLVLVGSANINGTGNDIANLITGNDGKNVLVGASGADTLNGGAGNDTLVGGKGNDIMSGGAGADIFRFALSNTNADRINGFEKSLDRFDLGGGSFTGRAESGGNTTLTHSGGTILVTGITGLSLNAWNALVLPTGGAAVVHEIVDTLGVPGPSHPDFMFA